MRGSPLFRALLAFLAIAALGWPLRQLTHLKGTAATPLAALPAEKSKAIGLQLTFTMPPRSFNIRHLEKEVWTENAPTMEMERRVELAFPDSGVDLVLHIEWPADAAVAAARVRLTDANGDAHEKSIWGRGEVDEVLTFP